MSTDHNDTHASPHTLAGATILQIVPALREEPVARTALIVAAALLQAGTRALVAAEDGPLAAELQALGGEFVPLVNATANPLKLRRGARKLEGLIASEHIDVVHAQSIGGAWIASMAAAKVAVWLVTTLPDVPAAPGLRAYWAGALARERVAVVPRSIDTATFDPAAVAPERIEALRKAWRIPQDARILLVPGRVAPFNGQIILPEVARTLLDAGLHGFVFVLAGEHRSFAKYARSIAEEAKAKGEQGLMRFTGHCRDRRAALAAADAVGVPAIEPPMRGRMLAQAQAMGRPVVTSNVGLLPEQVVTPPDMPEDVRTGWVAKAGDAKEFASALGTSFALDDSAYRTMAARARQFAQYMFSPAGVAAATLDVYNSLLQRDD